MGRKKRHTSDQVKSMIAEINNQTDRGAALIAVAGLDELLDVCIQNRLLEMNRAHYDALFGGNKPLGTFSAKIEMGYALGFYSESGYKMLHCLRDVRNKFAHRIEAITFDHPEIAEIVDPVLPDDLGSNRKQKFRSAFRTMALLLTSTQLENIRIPQIFDTNPGIYAELFSLIAPESAQAIRAVLLKKDTPS